ncbi:MAG: carbon monoxide dehydrogenase [Alphaproteobacteria bacterium]|nr:carbon monoxide dehydrogenase [Alphaproteobacteria bacterium]
MKITGEHHIPADRNTVWKALNDPEILKVCLPGCDSIEKTSDTHMNAKITTRIGPVKASFSGAVTLSDLDPPNGYTITGEGQGGAAGFASGGAKVSLVEDGPNATILSYEAEARVGGKLAQIGSRLIDSTVKKLSEEFFTAFAETVGGAGAAEAVAAPSTPSDARVEGPKGPARPAARPGVPTAIWVGGLVIVAIVLILVFAL